MKVIKLLTILLFGVTLSQAQNLATSSPYSMFGLGEYASGLYGQNSAMGGVSYGMQNAWLINTENPAGLIALENNRLYFEISVFAKKENYRSSGQTSNSVTGNCSAFIVAGKILPRWAMAIGLSPYTSVGYFFRDKQPLEGTPGAFVYSNYEGEGGISKLSVSNSFQVNKNLSVGINAGYLFGSSTLKETQEVMAVKNETSSRALFADFGIQYAYKMNTNTFLILGGVYGFKQKVNVKNSINVTTTSDPVDINSEKLTQYVPQFIGIGGSLRYKKTIYALDYSFKEYSVMESVNKQIEFKNVHEIRAGISYNPNQYLNSGFWKRSDYKAGIVLSNPYYSIDGKSGIAYRVSIGMSIPYANTRFDLAIFYDKLQIKNGLLGKNVIGLTLSCRYAELLHKAKLK